MWPQWRHAFYCCVNSHVPLFSWESLSATFLCGKPSDLSGLKTSMPLTEFRLLEILPRSQCGVYIYTAAWTFLIRQEKKHKAKRERMQIMLFISMTIINSLHVFYINPKGDICRCVCKMVSRQWHHFSLPVRESGSETWWLCCNWRRKITRTLHGHCRRTVVLSLQGPLI